MRPISRSKSQQIWVAKIVLELPQRHSDQQEPVAQSELKN